MFTTELFGILTFSIIAVICMVWSSTYVYKWNLATDHSLCLCLEFCIIKSVFCSSDMSHITIVYK